MFNIEASIAIKRMMAVRCPVCASSKILLGENRSLDEDRKMRPPHRGSPDLLAGIWLASGETGESSKTIAYPLREGSYRLPLFDRAHQTMIADNHLTLV